MVASLSSVGVLTDVICAAPVQPILASALLISYRPVTISSTTSPFSFRSPQVVLRSSLAPQWCCLVQKSWLYILILHANYFNIVWSIFCVLLTMNILTCLVFCENHDTQCTMFNFPSFRKKKNSLTDLIGTFDQRYFNSIDEIHLQFQ